MDERFVYDSVTRAGALGMAMKAGGVTEEWKKKKQKKQQRIERLSCECIK